MTRWLDEYNGTWNLYFSVNPPLRPMDKKAERQDIRSVDWLHVDLDPRAGEDLDEERARILASLTTRLPAGVPAPNVIVDSGGGYWGFWRLREPIQVDGDLTRAEAAKLYNLQLERLFGADSCHNIDRIARLPGTINIPDAKKKAKGRREAQVVIVHTDNGVYDIAQFTPAAQVQTPGEVGFSSGEDIEASLPGNLKKVLDLNELNEWGVPDRVLRIIAQGRDPLSDPKKGDDSRSAWMFDAVCQLVRCEVPDEIIYAILMDKDWGISECILDKGANATKHAARQIKRAKEFTVDPRLMEMNERFAVIGNMGGRCRVIEEVMDLALNRPRLTRQSFDDFRNRYMHQKVEVQTPKGPLYIPLGKWWLEHPKRRQYDTIAFAPGKERAGVYNLWKGFACLARPGDCSLLLTHILENICCGNEEHYEYLINWMARAVQRPDSPGQTAIVMRGGQGVGKSIFAKMFGSLFGRHFLQISDPKHLVGSFNAHLRDCVVLFSDEAFFAGDKKHESVLKMLITEEIIPIEGKGVDVEVSPNCTHVLLGSNSDWVIPAGKHERRYLVLDVSDRHRQDVEYFEALVNQMESGGREALLHLLMSRDLKGFNVRNVPKTDALRQQREFSLGPEEAWWYNKLVEGTLIGSEPWRLECLKEELMDDYVEHTRQFNIFRRGNQITLGMFLTRVCPLIVSRQKIVTTKKMGTDGWAREETRRAYVYTVPPLDEARRLWERVYGPQDWPVIELDDAAPELTPREAF